MKKILACITASCMFMMLAVAPAMAVAPVTVNFVYASADVTTFGVTAFSIERKAEACAGVNSAFAAIGTVGNTLRTFTDATVAASTTYCYRVRAVNAAGVSAPSNTAEKTTIADLPPAPTSVTAT